MDKKTMLIAAAIGATAGVVGYILYKKRKKAEKESDVVFEVTHEMVRNRAVDISGDNDGDDGIFVNNDPCIVEGADDEDMHVGNANFEFISMAEYENSEGLDTLFDRMQLTLYSDGVLIGEDESEGPLDAAETIGEEGLSMLMNNPYTNVVYIRNNTTACDYEVVAVPETFRELREDE